MDITKKSIVNFPVSALASFFLTTMFFVGIPLLTEYSTIRGEKEAYSAVIISQRKPPPPPEPDRDEKIEKKEPEQVKKKQQRTRQTIRPKLDVQLTGLSSGLGGTIQISGLVKSEFSVSSSLFVSAFNLNEVDQEPKIIRMIQPRYPFDAKQKGINGKVLLRFVVSADGTVVEPHVVKSEPENVFDQAALDAVIKYKFRPAKKGGKAVDCIVKLPISFDVTN